MSTASPVLLLLIASSHRLIVRIKCSVRQEGALKELETFYKCEINETEWLFNW